MGAYRAHRADTIAHINLARGFRGGERQTELLIRELAVRGVNQKLVARAGEPLTRRLEDCPGLTIRGVNSRLAAALAARRSGIVHAHEAKAAQAAWLASHWGGPPYLITRRVENPLRRNPITRSVHRRASALVVLSRSIRDAVLEAEATLSPFIIPSALSNLEPVPERVEELRMRFRDRFLFGHVGALVDRNKGQSVLIKAARELGDLGDVSFLLIGSGADEADLRAQAADLENLHFEGQVEDVGSYLSVLDVFVFPSRYEGLGSILIDAMGFGLPIVASRVGGIPDIVEHEVNGLLVPSDDPSALAAAMRRLYEDRKLRAVMAECNRQAAAALSAMVMADRYQEIYRSIAR